jgi:hypothetical protein
MTGLMMEFSTTHGTELYAQLRKAVKASPQITRLKGSALVLEPDSMAVGALVDMEFIQFYPSPTFGSRAGRLERKYHSLRRKR